MKFPQGSEISTSTTLSSGIQELITEANLPANGVFTSQLYKRLGTVFVDSINAIVFSEQAGTINIEESNDGITWGLVKAQAVTASVLAETGVIKIMKKFYRIRYVNGAVAQTDFHMYQTIISGLSLTQIVGSVIPDEQPVPIKVVNIKATTIQTHNAVSVALNSGQSPSIWIDTNGYDQIALAVTNDAATASTIELNWSNDSSTINGWERPLVSTTDKNRAGITPTKARYVRVVLINNDAALAHTMSAWAYLKA